MKQSIDLLAALGTEEQCSSNKKNVQASGRYKKGPLLARSAVPIHYESLASFSTGIPQTSIDVVSKPCDDENCQT